MIKNKKAARAAASVGYSVFRFALLIAIGYIVIYPVIYMISSSVKTPAAFSDPSIIYIPKKITFEYYSIAVKALDYVNSLLSTLKYELVSAVIEILICSFIAYGLARFDFKGKRFLNFVLILTILVPAQMIIIPMMTNYSQLDILGIFGLLNKLTGISDRIYSARRGRFICRRFSEWDCVRECLFISMFSFSKVCLRSLRRRHG